MYYHQTNQKWQFRSGSGAQILYVDAKDDFDENIPGKVYAITLLQTPPIL